VREIASRLAAATQGLSADKIALIVALGLVLGAFPVYGCPTILCGLAAIVLRLNLPALLLVNQMATPVQIALLVPLARTGSWIFGSRAGFGGAIRNAMAGWVCVCIPMGVLLYFTLGYVLRRLPGTPLLSDDFTPSGGRGAVPSAESLSA
jgi:apolipoprotein N-acyltransferase